MSADGIARLGPGRAQRVQVETAGADHDRDVERRRPDRHLALQRGRAQTQRQVPRHDPAIGQLQPGRQFERRQTLRPCRPVIETHEGEQDRRLRVLGAERQIRPDRARQVRDVAGERNAAAGERQRPGELGGSEIALGAQRKVRLAQTGRRGDAGETKGRSRILGTQGQARVQRRAGGEADLARQPGDDAREPRLRVERQARRTARRGATQRQAAERRVAVGMGAPARRSNGPPSFASSDQESA